MRKESPAQRQKRVSEAFTRKVEILEGWSRSGVPDGQTPPDNHASLRRWKGPDGDLETWSDPIVDRPVVGKYPELAARFVAAVEAIARKRTQASGDGGLSILQAENGRLRIQNATLLGEIDTHQRRVQLLENLLRNAGRPVPA
jgi:hypothetical protein